MIQLKQNNDIIYQGFTLNQYGFTAIGSPSFKQWEEVGKFIQRSHKAVKFWQGDWLNYGENNFEDWSQYFDSEDPESEKKKKEKWVARRIPISRRRNNLSWEHHAEVADLEPEDQDNLLNVAEENKFPIAKFKTLVRTYQMKLDLPELSDQEMLKTDPKLFEKVQEIMDSSIHTVELMEKLDWKSLHLDAKDFLFSHIKRVLGYYLDLLKSYDKQKQIPAEMV